MRRRRSRWVLAVWPLTALLVVPVLAGCGGGGDGGDVVTPLPGAVLGTVSTPGSDLEEIAARVDAVLALGYNTTNADALAKVLLDGNPDNDPFIVDTREPSDYAAGHIPGAVNIPLPSLPRALRLGTSGIPADRDVVVASYWGNDGNMASLTINLARVLDPSTPGSFRKSTSLFAGMTSWSFRRSLVPSDTRFEDAQAAGIVVEEDTETAANAGVDHGAYPAFASFGTSDLIERVLIRAERYLGSVANQTALQVYPRDIVAMVDAGTAQVISVRGAADYAKGHIPGAINIPYKDVAKLATHTLYVDPTKTAYVYCYTGHTGSLSAMALGILGYRARDVLYGMNGWTTGSAVASGQLASFDLMRGWDFPINDGGPGDLASMADFVPADGCQGCHTDLTSVFYDREIANVPPSEPAPPSEGEG